MYFIRIRTPQNVHINYPLAGPGKRIPAFIIDFLITFSYWFLLYWIFFEKLRVRHTEFQDWDYSNARQFNYYLTIIFIILTLPVYIYHFLCENFMNGQSFGKKIMGIKVIRTDGTQPDFQSLALRSVFRLVDIFFIGGIVAVVSIVLTRRGQRLGDIAAGTTVVSVKPYVTLEQLIQKPYSDSENNNKVVSILTPEQARMLTDKDIQIIRKALENKNTLSEKAMITLCNKVKKKTLYTGKIHHPVEFLEQVCDIYYKTEFKEEEMG